MARAQDVNDDEHVDLTVGGTAIYEICPRPDRCTWEYFPFTQVLLSNGLGGFAPPFGGVGAAGTVATSTR